MRQDGYTYLWNIPDYYIPTFLKTNPELPFVKQDQERSEIHLDAHWLIGPQFYQLDYAWQDLHFLTEEQDFYGITTRLFTVEGSLLTSCLHHGGKENWKKLKYVCDVAGLIDRHGATLRWDWLLEHAHRLKCRNLLLLGISIAYKIFSVDIPPLVKNQINKPIIQKYTARCIKNLFNPSPPRSPVASFLHLLRFHFQLREHFSTKVKILYYHLLKILQPNINDIPTKKPTTLDRLAQFFSKPLRLWKTYFS